MEDKKRMTVAERVAKVVSEQLGLMPADVTPEKYLSEDLGADDLDVVEIVMGLEEEFDTSLCDADAERMRTVGDVIGYFKDKESEEKHENERNN